MIGFLKGKAVGQVDKVLIEGKEYTEQELKEIVSVNKGQKPTQLSEWVNKEGVVR